MKKGCRRAFYGTHDVNFEEDINVDVDVYTCWFGFQMFINDIYITLLFGYSYFMDSLVGMELEWSAQGEGGGHRLEHPAAA